VQGAAAGTETSTCIAAPVAAKAVATGFAAITTAINGVTPALQTVASDAQLADFIAQVSSYSQCLLISAVVYVISIHV
jgi:hypothetical protein